MTRARDTANFVGTSVAGGKNLIPNGSFNVWQRGTSGTTTSYAYTCADKWLNYTDTGTVTLSQISVNGAVDGTPPGVKYAMRTNRTAGATADRFIAILVIDGALAYVGQTLTLSFYMRIGAGITGSPFGNVSTRTVKFGSSTETGGSSWNASTFNSTTFTRVSVPITITAATATAGADLFEVEIGVSPQATGTNTYFDLTGVQLELGTSATDFSLHGGTPIGEVQACQKYYQRVFNWTAVVDTTTTMGANSYLATPMRIAPTATKITGSTLSWRTPSTDNTSTTWAFSSPQTSTTSIWFQISAVSGLTAGQSVTNRGYGTDLIELTADY